MTVYFDTSSFIKLYVEEDGSEAVHELIASGEEPASSEVLRVELRGALARIHRASNIDPTGHTMALQKFEADWRNVVKMAVSDTILELAAELAERHFLRALDAIHLASALTLDRRQEGELVLSSWDGSLLDAAVAEGIRVVSVA